MPRSLTRGERAIEWVRHWCVMPGGKPVELSADERVIVYRLYDGVELAAEGVKGPLAAYLSLLHLCGPEAQPGAGIQPRFATDVFSLWNAASPALRAHLRRHGDRVICPDLGTVWPAAA